MRVKGRVELATYRMRQRGLEVSSTFLDDVDALPLTYEKGQYFAFLEDYGTHFTKNGKSGGEYELIYIMNEDILKQKGKFDSHTSSFFLSPGDLRATSQNVLAFPKDIHDSKIL